MITASESTPGSCMSTRLGCFREEAHSEAAGAAGATELASDTCCDAGTNRARARVADANAARRSAGQAADGNFELLWPRCSLGATGRASDSGGARERTTAG